MIDLFFKAFDGDKSGTLDFTELSAILIMEAGGDDKQSMELVFKMFDSNGDNKVDAKELESVLKVSD
jgi:Ca2+-binding EF-hand superfamily protein